MLLWLRIRAVVVSVLCVFGAARAHAAYDPNWTTPIAPFRIADNLYYVGSRDLGAYLVTTPAGNILINSNLPSSPPQIRHSVEQLGFRWRDIKVLLISHAHVDHAGGSAQILRETGAEYEVMDGDAEVVENIGKSDSALAAAGKMPVPAAHVNRVLRDGDTVTLGGVRLVAHRTPGHTKGCTTWTMQAHVPGEPAGKLRDVVIGGSWTVLSSYRLLGERNRPPSYAGIAADYTHTFSVLPMLPCDIFLASHGSTFNMLGKLKRMPAEGDKVWIDPAGYRQAIAQATRAFEVAYERESKSAAEGSRP